MRGTERPLPEPVLKPALREQEQLEPTDILEGVPGFDPFTLAGAATYDEQRAQAAIDWFPANIRHAKGGAAGRPFVLEPWEQALIGNLFGWRNPDGTRRFRRAFLYVPKKNGKTALAAALTLYFLVTEVGPYGEVYGAASKKDQARLLYSHCVGMIGNNPDLRDLLRVYGSSAGAQMHAIQHKENGAAYRCIPANEGGIDGAATSMAVIDELHRHDKPDLADILWKGAAEQADPLLIYTTTADYNRPSLCNRMLEYAKSVRDNPGDPGLPGYDATFLPVIYEATKEDDWRDLATWRKANPNFGVTVREDFARGMIQEARDDPTQVNSLQRLHLNIVTDADEAYLDLDQWDRCKGPEPADLQRGFMGLDLSTTRDYTAAAVAYPLPDGRVYLQTRFWIPKKAADVRVKQERNKVPLEAWVRAGDLQRTAGSEVDYDAVETWVMETWKARKLAEVAIDRWNSTSTVRRLDEEGLNIVKFGQGFADMTAPTKELARLIADRKLVHDGNPVMRWMIGNLMVERDAADNVKPSKKASAEKIDGPVAAIMALGRLMVVGQPRGSIYNERGPIVL